MTLVSPDAAPLLRPGYESPLLQSAGAVAADGLDAGTALHYGDPLGEQRVLENGAGLVDRSNRGVLTVAGVDRLDWLHSICSQFVSDLVDGESTRALVLSPHGHVEQDWQLTELDGQVWLDVEPGTAEAVLAYLLKMRFMKRVEPVDLSDSFAVLSVLGPSAAATLARAGEPVPRSTSEPTESVAVGRIVAGAPTAAGGRAPVTPAVARSAGGFVRARADGFDLLLPRTDVIEVTDALRTAGARPVGSWAASAVRVERRQVRLGWDTDHRTLPHEIGWIGVSVHLNKGCYRGQETVARVHNLGRPPRSLVLLHLSGERDELPEPATAVELDGRSVGFLGTAVHHHELGPIALAVVKRAVAERGERGLVVAGMSAAVDV